MSNITFVENSPKKLDKNSQDAVRTSKSSLYASFGNSSKNGNKKMPSQRNVSSLPIWLIIVIIFAVIQFFFLIFISVGTDCTILELIIFLLIFPLYFLPV